MARHKFNIVLLIFLLSFDQITVGKRGGSGIGRGGSGSRGGGGLFSSGGSRGNSGARSGSTFGRGSTGGGLSKPQSSGGFGHGSQGLTGNKGSGSGWGHSSGTSSRDWRHSKYNKGIGRGSSARSDMFKNMIVGAAAGYLTYQAGKYLIRNIATPMMWGGRPYYWGSNYYQPRLGYSTMCRMPFNENDPTFGNIYTSDHSRPKELVWSCLADEECCGNECCPRLYGGYGGGYGSGYYNRSPGIGLWFILLLLLLCCCCGGLIIYNLYKKGTFGNKYYSGAPTSDGELL